MSGIYADAILTVSFNAFLACAAVKPISDIIEMASEDGSGPDPDVVCNWIGSSMSVRNGLGVVGGRIGRKTKVIIY